MIWFTSNAINELTIQWTRSKLGQGFELQVGFVLPQSTPVSAKGPDNDSKKQRLSW